MRAGTWGYSSLKPFVPLDDLYRLARLIYAYTTTPVNNNARQEPEKRTGLIHVCASAVPSVQTESWEF